MVTAAFMGDVAFFPSIIKEAQKHRTDWLWEDLASALKTDLVIDNFEFPFSEEREPAFDHSWAGHRAPEEAMKFMKQLTVSVHSLANNHIMDWGLEGLICTRRKLSSLGAEVIGAGENSNVARRPAILSANGLRIGFLAYCKKGVFSAGPDRPGAALLEPNAIVTDIRSLKKSVDHVIVILHWGVEFSDYPYPPDIDIAHQIIDAGASAIIGHHPHVVQGLEIYEQKPIFYSLGSLIYDPYGERVFVENVLGKRLQAIVVNLEFTKEGNVDWEYIPFRQSSEKRPVRLTGSDEISFRHQFEMLSKEILQAKTLFYQHSANRLLSRELRTIWALAKQSRGIYLVKFARSLQIRHLRILAGAAKARIFRI